MSEIVKIPKGWKQVSEHCFIDNKGNPHLRTKKEYKTTPTARTYSLKYAKKNRNTANQTSSDWKLKNPKKVEIQNKRIKGLFYDCVKRAKKLRSTQFRKKLKSQKKDGRLANCIEFHHGRCKNVRNNCTCNCHKNT